MNAVLPVTPTSSSAARADLGGLVQAVSQSVAEDGLLNPFTPEQWELLAGYLLPMQVEAGHTLFTQGVQDRTLYFIESGSCSVHYEDDKGRLRLAIVGAGSVVGEGAFFSHRPRSATVQAGAPSRLWTLTALRFSELSNRQPAVALALAMAAGSVLARRLGNRRRRVAAT